MNCLILDTGPLVEYAIYGFKSRLPSKRPLLEEAIRLLRTPAQVDTLLAFIRRYSARETVSGVLSEIQNHFYRFEKCLKPPEKASFWRYLTEIWKQFEMSEQLVIFGELDLSIIHQDGPVDLALAALAQRRLGTHEEVKLLTIEEKSLGRWRGYGVPAISLAEVLHGGPN